MGQKVNPNLFNFKSSLANKSRFIEKKRSDYSVLTATDFEIKASIQNFFKGYKIIMNNCRLLHLNNLFYIYVSYQQKIKNGLLELNKIKVIDNCFNLKKIKIKQPENRGKKSFNSSWKWVKFYKFIGLKKHYKKATLETLEISSFLKVFFSSLLRFKSKKSNIFLTLEKQNKKLLHLKKKQALFKRKQKLTLLRKYKNNEFFKEGVNLLMTSIAHKNSSKLLADFLSLKLENLKSNNFLIRFIKNTLIILNSKAFFSVIKGIKINIKGRFNSNPRAKNRLILISNLPPLRTKKSRVDYFEKSAHTLNGTFGIKIWTHQY